MSDQSDASRASQVVGGPDDASMVPKVFARKASGMIRSASTWDVFGLNLNNTLLGIGAAFVLSFVPALYPGANLYLSIVLGGLLCVPMAVTFARMSAVYPRSGGDYVFNSRSLSPSVGFAWNFGFVVFMGYFLGAGGVYVATYGVAPLLESIGILYRNTAFVDASIWVSSRTGTLTVAIISLALFFLVLTVAGTRTYFRIQSVITVAGMAAVAILVVAGFALSRTGAISHLNSTLAAAGGAGVSEIVKTPAPRAAFSLMETLKASLWTIGTVMGAILSGYIGGEVKRPARAQLLGMTAAVGWSTGWLLLIVVAMVKFLGIDFWANLALMDLSKTGFSSLPLYPEVTSLAMKSGLVAIVTMALFAFWGFAWLGPVLLSVTRSMFAWAMDRIIPSWFAAVHPRWHTPHHIMFVVFIGSVIWAAFYIWGQFTFVGGNLDFYSALLLVAISSVVLPYRHRELWRSSPGNGTIWGIPWNVPLGILSAATMGLILYLLLVDEYSGTHYSLNRGLVIVSVGMIVVGFALFHIARVVQSRHGVNINLAFQEVPPE